MSLHDLSVVILISLLIVLLPAIGLAKLFPKAGIASWKAWVPFLNTWEILKVGRFKKFWFWLQFIPVLGWFISIWILVEFVKLFGRFSFLDHAGAVLIPIIYFPYIANHKDTRYIGPESARKHRKSAVREWVDAAVFAVVAATLIRTFVFEAYTIPTGSMEKTLLVNDFLFVSKLSYGPRIPNTPLAFPFVHHTMPITGGKSYSEAIKLPYTRWFSSPVKRNDVVVFNFPAGDTLTKEFDSQEPYYDLVRQDGREAVWQNYTILTRPVDKRENYIKRCVAIAGDTIEIKDGLLYVNNEKAFISPTSATVYDVRMSVDIDEDALREQGIYMTSEERNPDLIKMGGGNFKINLTESELELLKKMPGFLSAQREILSVSPMIYPNDPAKFPWSPDNFGKLWIPKKGATIRLTPENVLLYKRAIKVYENNEWEEQGGKILINGQPAETYTFKMDYFWMMGDNRHKSQDSRFWGFVPEDHVVGEAWMIWMSWDKGVRWKRLFKTIH
ncbi:signal peptidase I [Pseudoflavitalea sp. G-6-1-2]|uniref:signal peptidase I n=1 Tax=Pseudoflavitalea sp. G-6-1-2 TaxID=2728841 RepID=UPI00146C8923|nr:signal peptidase I [Pseudoflavitalea sp. G-6-1-2]NML21551.1 signal peptidase I [Pseudoflavitalea sp. G-6-1-2]